MRDLNFQRALKKYRSMKNQCRWVDFQPERLFCVLYLYATHQLRYRKELLYLRTFNRGKITVSPLRCVFRSYRLYAPFYFATRTAIRTRHLRADQLELSDNTRVQVDLV